MTSNTKRFLIIPIKVLTCLILLSGSSCHLSLSQILKGKITDKTGVPVPYATVFIQEIKQGTTSNTKGDYELRLPPGKYLVIYQSLGFEPVIEPIKLYDSVITRNVVLYEQIYDIPEVKISPSGEDPAVAIMRRVIALAPYYLNYIDYYKAEVYLKGNLVINRIPKLIQKSMRMQQSDENVSVSAGGKPVSGSRIIKEGDAFLMESFNEIEFTAPDKYVQRVISFNSTFPEQQNEVSPMDYIQASFYQPVLAEIAVSPLSPKAFSYYNFKYLGATFQGDITVNKIEVIPKRKSQQVFEGIIYIIEDLWCLHSVDLTNENLAGKIRVRELYIPVQKEVWMPVSHQFNVELKIIGIRADAGYSSSVKYLDVKPNLRLQKPSDISAGFPGRSIPDSAVTKTSREVNRILQKEELTNRDMIRLSRLMEKETAETRKGSTSKSLEIKDNTVHIIEKDAAKKDSAYWSEIRPIPLSDIEQKSLAINDSIKKSLRNITSSVNDTTATGNNNKQGKFGKSVKNIFFGHTWSDTTGFSFTNGGIIDLKNLSFNTVDGFKYGIDFRINKRFNSQKSVSIYPDLSYAFSRKRLLWRINANYSIRGMKPKQLFIRAGSACKDIGSGGGIDPLINSITSLLFRKNYLKLYESQYFGLGYKTEIRNGLDLEFSGGFENRKILENNTEFSLLHPDREYTDNTPDNEYLDPGSNPINFPADQKHLEIVTNVTFTPFQKYRIYDGNKDPGGSDWPTFQVTWKHFANKALSMSDEFMHFDLFRFEASQIINTGPFSEFKWRLRTGGYADNRKLSYFDFFHFNAQPLTVLLNDYEDAFFLPSYYSLSTPEFFGEIHLKYTTPYLLLKLLPVLSNTLTRENLSLSYLGSRFHKNYFEAGYSLSEIFFIGSVGVYVGFENLNYNSIGLRFTLRLN